MNELTVREERSIETVTAEICVLRDTARRVVLQTAIEIGRRLTEAKELLPYGEWGRWLEERVEFSHVTATRYMKLFEEYGAAQGSLFGAETDFSTLKNLSVSNALRLLTVPEEEREAFAAEHDVENLSAREMDKLMKQVEDERARAEEAEKQLDKTEEELIKAEDELKDLRSEREELTEELEGVRDELKQLQSRPVEVAVQEPDPAELQKAIDAAVADAAKAHAEKERALKAKLKEAKSAAEEAEKKAKEAEGKLTAAEENAAAGAAALEEKAALEKRLEEMQKQLAMSDAAVTRFKTIFEQAQTVFNNLTKALGEVSDEETRGKLRLAVEKLLEAFGKRIEG